MRSLQIPTYLYHLFKGNHVYSPRETAFQETTFQEAVSPQAAFQQGKEPKVAICLFGLVGGIKGKTRESSLSSQEVLELGFRHYDEHFFKKNKNIDVFVHTWSTELEQPILTLYKPRKSIFEKQKQFEMSDQMEGTEQRKFVHYSMTYSIKKVVELKAAYEKEQGI